MKKWLVLIFFILLSGGCVLSTLETQEGVVWEYQPTGGDLKVGVELGVETVYFGDGGGNIYALHMRTGNLKWQRTLNSGEDLRVLYCSPTALYAVSKASWESDANLWEFSLDQGELVTNITLTGFDPTNGYTVYTNSSDVLKLILHSATKVVSIDLSTLAVTSQDFSGSLNIDEHICKVLHANMLLTDYLFLVTDLSRMLKLDASLNLQSTYQSGTAHTGYGSALYANSRFYIGTLDGVYVMDNNGTWDSAPLTGYPVKHANMSVNYAQTALYAPLADYPRSGIAKFDISSYQNSESWFFQTYNNVNYSSTVLSELYNMVLVLDDGGYLSVVNSEDGTMITSKYFGTVGSDALKAAFDEGEQIVFFPFSVPSKVICYSLDYPESLSTQSRDKTKAN